MMSPPQPVPVIQKGLGASARRFLVVEGKDDLAIYSQWLIKLAAPNPFPMTLELVEAKGKLAVLACLRWFADNGGEPRVFGLVDRDEWDAATVVHWCGTLPQLRVHANRHAIESYFCDPAEIVPSLLHIDPAWASQQTAFQATITAALSDYVGHWALLTVTDRLKTRMMDHGYPGQFSTTIPIPPDGDIQARFQQWATTLDPAAAFTEFDTLRHAALAADQTTQFRSHVWAKLFFERVVHPLLNGPPTTHQQSGHDWLVSLAANGPQVPADITAILQPLL
jgi:hypothetical protein